MKLLKEDGEEAGLYDICQWIIEIYPKDVFLSSEHPVHIMRDKAKEVLGLRK